MLLKMMHHATNQTIFLDIFGKFKKLLDSDDKYDHFGSYFNANYSEKADQWAMCYRLETGITCNNYIEAFHRDFKGNYLGGKKNQRVDQCMHNLLKFARDIKFKRVRFLVKNKYTRKEDDIRKRHNTALQLTGKITPLDENAWNVQSEKNEDMSYVVELKNTTCHDECLIKCRPCKICPHMYTCDCIDHLNSLRICKHIHYVVLNYPREVITTKADEVQLNLEELGPCAEGDITNVDFDANRLSENLKVLLTLIDSENVEKSPKFLIDTNQQVLIAIQKLKTLPVEIATEPVNKKQEPQRRFFAKKRKVTMASSKYHNPSQEEEEELMDMLCELE